jgi:hypothetical protein
MKNGNPTPRPNGRVRRPVGCCTSDREFDFGAPVLPDLRRMCDCWRAEQVERDRGLRADVYTSLGLM